MTMRVKKITGLAGSLPGSSLVRKSRSLPWNGQKTVTKCTYIIQLQRNNSCIYTTKLHHVYISNVKQCGSPLLVAKSRSKVMCQLPLAHLLHPARKSRDLDKSWHNNLSINYINQVKLHLKLIWTQICWLTLKNQLTYFFEHCHQLIIQYSLIWPTIHWF